MSVEGLLASLRDRGVSVELEADRLKIRAPKGEVTPGELDQLRAAKAEVLRFLTSGRWRALLRKRQIARAGLHPQDGDCLAFSDVIDAWCAENPTRGAPGACMQCGQPLTDIALDLPGGAIHVEPLDCLIAFGVARRQRAAAALAQVGIEPPAEWEP